MHRHIIIYPASKCYNHLTTVRISLFSFALGKKFVIIAIVNSNKYAQVFTMRTKTDSEFKAECRVLMERAPFQARPEEPIVRILWTYAKAVRGVDPNPIGVSFWMDSALLAEAGEGAHAVVEWVDLDSVGQCLDVLNAVIADFCG